MSTQLDSAQPGRVELFLSGTYRRIRLNTIVLGVAGAIAAEVFFGWRGGLGIAAGTAVGFINLVWLHHGSEMMIERMLAPRGQSPSKLRLLAAFTARYIFVLAMAYVIVKGFPSILLAFTIGLFLPILAAVCEGVYETFVNATEKVGGNS